MNQVKLKPEVIVKASNTHLHHHFFVESRAYSKSLFNTLSDGKRVPLLVFELSNNSELNCDLELDSSEHIGHLNYGKFRKALEMMIVSLQHRLEANESLNPMNSETGELLFNIPGIVKHENTVNIMLCGFRQLAPGLSAVRLMYVNPNTYADAAGIDLKKL